MSPLSRFHHIKLVVSNAKQSAFWYCSSFGCYAHARLDTEEATSIAIKNENVIFVFVSYHKMNCETRNYYIQHGDSVRDVAFSVDNLDNVLSVLSAEDLHCLQKQQVLSDEFGSVKIATVRAKGSDFVHTLVENIDYTGPFLPGYQAISQPTSSLLQSLPPVPMEEIDHIVENYPKDLVEPITEWYIKTMQLHRFWSVDDQFFVADYSGLKAWLVVNEDHKVQVTVAEPVETPRRGKSQIQEFLDFNGGPGIQHIALKVNNIIDAVVAMKARGVEFLTVPKSYYEDIRERLRCSKVNVSEDINRLSELSILMDFDDNGYLLQIFTKPVQDRPTTFIEIIQRRNFNGFGAGNFKALFEAVEREQAKRGTL